MFTAKSGEGSYFSTACLPGLYSCSFHAKLIAKWPGLNEEALVVSAGLPSCVNTPEQAFLCLRHNEQGVVPRAFAGSTVSDTGDGG